jgi:hypothetical protein
MFAPDTKSLCYGLSTLALAGVLLGACAGPPPPEPVATAPDEQVRGADAAANHHYDHDGHDLQLRADRADGAAAATRRNGPALSWSADGLGARVLELQGRQLGLDTRALRRAAATDRAMDPRPLGPAARRHLGLGRRRLDQLSSTDPRGAVEETAAAHWSMFRSM